MDDPPELLLGHPGHAGVQRGVDLARVLESRLKIFKELPPGKTWIKNSNNFTNFTHYGNTGYQEFIS